MRLTRSGRRSETTTNLTTLNLLNHNASIAQLVEQLICNQFVVGSTPIGGFKEKSKMNEELPDVEPPWFSMPTEGEYSEDLEDGTPYDMGYKVDEQ